MAVLVFLWGLDYIAAKYTLKVVHPLSLICIKYLIGFVFLIMIKLIIDRSFFLKRKDLPVIIISALFGDVLYFAAEYGAMSYLPISIITIVLAFVPSTSVATELLLYKRKPTMLIIVGVLVSVIGVGLVVGADFSELFQGKYIGYLLAFGAVISWNVYNFMTKGLSRRYTPLDLTLLQQVCAILMVLPFTLANLPSPEEINTPVLTGVLYLGVISAGIGFLIYVQAIKVIGPTPCALYSNFLPVTSTVLSWIVLGEHITGLQMLGGAVVIVSGTIVIREKGKEDFASLSQNKQNSGAD